MNLQSNLHNDKDLNPPFPTFLLALALKKLIHQANK